MMTDGCGVEGCRVLVVVLRQRTGKKCKHIHSMMMHAAWGGRLCCYSYISNAQARDVGHDDVEVAGDMRTRISDK